MNKKHFIQSIMIRSLPTLAKVEAGVRYAEQMWDKLTTLGYGAAKEPQPREMRNYFDELSVYQRGWFDKFWAAFAHKKGLNRAALAWQKLGEPSETEYMMIVEAAKAEAKKPRKESEVRKMAEGWLTERRFDDYSKSTKQADSGNVAQQTKQAIFSELQSLKRLNAATPSDAYQKRIGELEVLLDELR